MYYIEKDHEPIVSRKPTRWCRKKCAAERKPEAICNVCPFSQAVSFVVTAAGTTAERYGIQAPSTRHGTGIAMPSSRNENTAKHRPLKEESFEEAFVEVFNGLIADKDEIMENYRLCIDAVSDDSEYRRQLEDLNNGCGEVQMLIRSLLMTYSRQDTADDIHEKLKNMRSGSIQWLGSSRSLI